MALRADDIQIAPADGVGLVELVADQTTTIDIRVELRGAAATVSNGATITVIADATSSLALTGTVSTAGYIRASLTAANVTTLGLQLGDTVDLVVQGVVADGNDTHTIAQRLSGVMVSSLTRFGVLYEYLSERYPSLAKSCAYPTGQTNWHPQLRAGLREFRLDLASRGQLYTRLAYTQQVVSLATHYALRAVVVAADSQVVGSTSYWLERSNYHTAEIEKGWKVLAASVQVGTVDRDEIPTVTFRRLESDNYRRRNTDPGWRGGGL